MITVKAYVKNTKRGNINKLSNKPIFIHLLIIL